MRVCERTCVCGCTSCVCTRVRVVSACVCARRDANGRKRSRENLTAVEISSYASTACNRF